VRSISVTEKFRFIRWPIYGEASHNSRPLFGSELQGTCGPCWPPAAREAALTVRPASASGEPTTPAPDYPFKIEFTGWSRVEAILDFGPHPAKLLTAALLMQDCSDDGGLVAAILASRTCDVTNFSRMAGSFMAMIGVTT
jgi:hypothetical protein